MRIRTRATGAAAWERAAGRTGQERRSMAERCGSDNSQRTREKKLKSTARSAAQRAVHETAGSVELVHSLR